MASKKKAEGAKDQNVHLRISAELKEAIEAAAKKDRRSMSAWIVVTLEDALGLGDADAAGERRPAMARR
jgi:hypothetical protein